MSNTIKIVIPEGTSNYIESLQYEVNARKTLLSFCIDKGMDINGETFKKYHDEYVEFVAKYEIAKKELSDTFVAPTYPGAKWSLDFDSNTLTVIEVE